MEKPQILRWLAEIEKLREKGRILKNVEIPTFMTIFTPKKKRQVTCSNLARQEAWKYWICEILDPEKSVKKHEKNLKKDLHYLTT